jgi:hypothetical protein
MTENPTLQQIAGESLRVDREMDELRAEVQRLRVFVLNLAEVNVTLAPPPAPVELPAHWRALSQILRNLADRIVHMTSANRGHVLKQLSDVEWSRWQGEWEKCVLCDTPTLFHEFDCPAQALETLMKVHGGVL